MSVVMAYSAGAMADASRSDVSGFRQEAEGVLLELRGALRGLTDALGVPIRKSRDLEKVLEVDSRLSWNVFKLTGGADVLSVGSHVPVPNAMRRLVAAARGHGVGEEILGGVDRAYGRFEALVERHAGSRVTYEAMLRGAVGSPAGESGEAEGDPDLVYRKGMFKGHSHLWGYEVETFVKSVVATPGSEKGRVDFGNLRARVGFRRFRPDAPVAVDSYKLTDRSQEQDVYLRDALDMEAAKAHQSAIVPRFSTMPLPAMRTRELADGRTRTELASPGQIGKTGAVDLVFGEISRNGPLSHSWKDERLGISSQIRYLTPTQLFYGDIWVDTEAFGKVEPSVTVFGDPNAIENDVMRKEMFQLKIPAKLVRVGKGLGCARMAEVPRYEEMMKFVFERMGKDAGKFELYRLRLEYPVLLTVVEMRLDLIR